MVDLTKEEINYFGNGFGNFYRSFNDYVSFPSFEDVLNGKGKYNKFQYDGLRNFVFSSTEPKQVIENIKNGIEFLNSQGFNEYSWKGFQEHFSNWETIKKEKLIEVARFELDNYVPNVECFHEIQPFFYDEVGNFWLWNKNNFCYQLTDEINILNLIEKKLRLFNQTIESKHKSCYMEAFKRVGRLRTPQTMPKYMVQFKSKLFNIKTNEFSNISSAYFATNSIPYNLGTTSDTPVMDKLIEEWVGKDYVPTMYEIIAYCCLIDYPLQFVFGFIGCGRNGKSKFLGILHRFLGVSNICSASLDKIVNPNSRFETAKMYKKLACFMSETNFDALNCTSALKSLCGGDLQDFEFKGKNSIFEINYAKLIIASNSLPTSNDQSDGFSRRWLIIDFPNTFEEGKDILETIPIEEYNNLAKKVTEILPNLLEKGKFTNQGDIEERKKRFQLASNPITLFIETCCDVSHPLNYESKNDLYVAYCKFLRQIKARVVSRKEMELALNNEGYYTTRSNRKVKNNKENIISELYDTTWWFDGIQLKKDFVLFVPFVQRFSTPSLYTEFTDLRNNTQIAQIAQSQEKNTQIKVISAEVTDFDTQKTEDWNIINEKDILFYINTQGKEGLVEIEQLYADLGNISGLIQNMLSKGILFQPTPTTIKIL